MTQYKEHLNSLQECPFCKNDHTVILSTKFHKICCALAPYGSNHLLIIPHQHITSLLDYTEEMKVDFMTLQSKTTKFLYNQWHKELVRLLRDWKEHNSIKLNRDTSTTWKTLAHLHYHAIPDCVIVAKDLADPKKSDSRKLISKNDINQLKSSFLRLYN